MREKRENPHIKEDEMWMSEDFVYICPEYSQFSQLFTNWLNKFMITFVAIFDYVV